METIKIDNCIGYVWWSNDNAPKIYRNNPLELLLNENDNPFVIEAQFKDDKQSHSIKYVDGQYIHNVYELSEDVEKSIRRCTPHFRKEGLSTLVFEQRWRAEQDILCENWEVLQPKELIFVGFEDGKEEEL